MLGKPDSYIKKNQTGLISHAMYKRKLKWIKYLSVRPEAIKLLGKNHRNTGSMLFGIGLSNIFFGSVSSGKGNKSKNKQMELCQTKKLLHSKWNYQQQQKSLPTEWEKIFANDISDEGLIS